MKGILDIALLERKYIDTQECAGYSIIIGQTSCIKADSIHEATLKTDNAKLVLAMGQTEGSTFTQLVTLA